MTKTELLTNLTSLSSSEMRTLNRYHLHPEDKRCCSKCFTIYEDYKSQFHIKKYYPDGSAGYTTECRTCLNSRQKACQLEKRKSPEAMIKQRVIQLRNRAKNEGLAFDLTADYLVNQWNKQSGQCYYTEKELDFTLINEGLTHAHDMAPSVDKLDPSLGYTQGNVVWCLHAINKMKSNFTYDQFMGMCAHILEVRKPF